MSRILADKSLGDLLETIDGAAGFSPPAGNDQNVLRLRLNVLVKEHGYAQTDEEGRYHLTDDGREMLRLYRIRRSRDENLQ